MSIAFNPVDIHVGHRIRMRRNILGLSQQELAQALGITFQQVQKYERGANRISASRLYHVTKVLNVEIPFFFDDYQDEYASKEGEDGALREDAPKVYEADPMVSDETLQVIRAYYKMEPEARQLLVQFLERIGTSRRARAVQPQDDQESSLETQEVC